MAIFDPSENFCDREQRPGGFFDGWDRRISAHSRHQGTMVHMHIVKIYGFVNVCHHFSSFKLHLFFTLV